jgi:hypothetical protein
MKTLKDITDCFGVSRNTAREMFLKVWQAGSKNVVKYKNTMAIIDFDCFLNELNNLEEERRKCKRKSKDCTKEMGHTGLMSQSMVKEFANQLASIL